MPRKIRVLLAGQQLVDALQRTVPLIKVLGSDGRVVTHGGAARLLTAKEAIFLVNHSDFGEYVGETTPAQVRVYSMWQFNLDPRPRGLWIPAPEFWDERAVIRYAADLRNIPAKMRNQEIEDMWDRMLKMSPPPKSWKRP
jgi:hypothetical protein